VDGWKRVFTAIRLRVINAANSGGNERCQSGEGLCRSPGSREVFSYQNRQEWCLGIAFASTLNEKVGLESLMEACL
jgi:hypothetical protein